MKLEKLCYLVLLLYVATADSAIYKCKTATGGYLYSDQKCVDESSQSIMTFEEHKIEAKPENVVKSQTTATNINTASSGANQKQLGEHQKHMEVHKQKLAEHKKKMDALTAENYS
jgi:hypothetical protein